MSTYRYTESGLDNVIIVGMQPCTDDSGATVYHVPYVNRLHKAIAEGIVGHPKGMNGKELRFLRTEMGKTQAELARVLHVEALTVGRWERGEFPIDSKAEALIRLLAIEELGLDVPNADVANISERCMPTAETQPLNIDGHDPANYRVMDMAA